MVMLVCNRLRFGAQSILSKSESKKLHSLSMSTVSPFTALFSILLKVISQEKKITIFGVLYKFSTLLFQMIWLPSKETDVFEAVTNF